MQLRFASFAVINLRRDLHPQECAHAGRTGGGRVPPAGGHERNTATRRSARATDLSRPAVTIKARHRKH